MYASLDLSELRPTANISASESLFFLPSFVAIATSLITLPDEYEAEVAEFNRIEDKPAIANVSSICAGFIIAS